MGTIAYPNQARQEFGPVDVTTSLPGTTRTAGGTKELVVPFKFDSLPTASSVDASFQFIPANSIVTRVIVRPAAAVGVAFAGGTSYTIGTDQANGTDIAAAGLANGITLAQLNAGCVLVVGHAQAGTQIGVGIGAINAFVVAVATGTFTAGSTELVIEYV